MKKFVAWIVLFTALILIVSLATAQDYTITISPTSGPPGTTVTISPNQSYNDARCYANGQQLSGTNYTIPGNASGSVTFYCEAGTGEFYVRSNDAAFTVVLPDGDGDGVPDGQDACPNEPFQSADGCPPPPEQPQQPEDSDGDGIPNEQDACPFDAGPADNNGCPVEGGEPASPPPPAVTPQARPVPTQTQAPVLPALPDDGACYVATQSATAVNVRARPTTEADITGALDPTNVYMASLRYNDGENIWFWVDEFNGWVAGFVVRQTGPCDFVPFGTEDGALDTDSIRLADLDLSEILSACPDLISGALELPLQVQNYIADHPDPCGTARRLLEEVMFTGPSYYILPRLPEETLDTLLENCATHIPILSEQLTYLYTTDDEIYESRLAAINEQACDVGLWDGVSQGWGLQTGEGLGYTFIAHCKIPLGVPGDGAPTKALLYSDFPVDVVPDLDYHPLLSMLGCGLAGVIVEMGELRPVELRLAHLLHDECGLAYQPDVAALLYFNYLNMIDADDIFPLDSESTDALCDNPNNYLSRFAVPLGTRPLDPSEVPNGMQSCPEVALELEQFHYEDSGATIRIDDLIGILSSHDPCHAARAFLRGGEAPDVPDGLVEEHECVIRDALPPELNDIAVLLYPDARMDFTSDWEDKLIIVDELVTQYYGGLYGGISPCSESGEHLFSVDMLGNIDRWNELDHVCHYVSFWVKADTNGINYRGGQAYVEISLWQFIDYTLPVRATNGVRRTPIDGEFPVSFYAMFPPLSAGNVEPWMVYHMPGGGSAEFVDPGDGTAWRGYGRNRYLGTVEAVDERLCETGAAAPNYPRNPDEVGAAIAPLDEEGEDGEVYQADDSVASAAEAGGEDSTDEVQQLVTELPIVPVSLIDIGDVERVRGGELIDDERRLSDILEADCGIAWEPDGREIVQYAVSIDLVMELLARSEAAPDAFCDQMQDLGSDLATGDEGEIYLLPASSEGAGGEDVPGAGETPPEQPAPPDTDDAGDGIDAPPEKSEPPSTRDELRDATAAHPLMGALGVLQVRQDDRSRLMLLTSSGELVPLTADFDLDALLPAIGPDQERVVFIAEDVDGTRQLMLLDYTSLDRILVGLNVGPYDVLPYQAVWMPDDNNLLVTLADEAGTPGIYRLNLDDETLRLIIADAVSPAVDEQGRIMAFVREDNGVPNIYSTSLSEPAARPITAETEGTGCMNPAFDASSLTLYLQCGEAVYQYRTDGITPLIEAGVVDYAPGPLDESILYTDGQGLYLFNRTIEETQEIGMIGEDILSLGWGR